MPLPRICAIDILYYHKCCHATVRSSICYCNNGPLPSNIDYELWQGPAPRMPFNDNYVHYNWHWFWHWGGGELTNNEIQFLDRCRIGLGVEYTSRVTLAGGCYHYMDEQETPYTEIISYDFRDRKSMH